MPPKTKNKGYLIILVNLGRTDETKDGNDTSFLERSKVVMRQLIQRKIFLLPKDEIGIITMGASESENQLSYDHIVEMNPLKVASWNLVESVMELKSTKENGNWVDGMSVVLDYINRECLEKTATRSVVLLNDFQEESNVIEQYSADLIAEEIKHAGIKLLAIGNRLLSGDTQTKLNPSEQLFNDVCKMVHGDTMTFDSAIPKLMIYKDEPTKPMPWKVDMDLFDIGIPVVVYLKTTEDSKRPKLRLVTECKRNTTQAEHVPIERNRALVDKDKTVIDPDNIITGYMYGRKFIPFTDEDKAQQKYKSEKGFMIYGFTKRQCITMDCLSGKGSYIVVPVQEWAGPFYSLVKAMADSNKVAIVRRVYRPNTAPKIGVLFPKLDVTPGEPWCLVYIELTFAEDRRVVQRRHLGLTISKLTDDQKEAVDNLIDSMMLMEVEDDSTKEVYEAFQPGSVPNVSRQHSFNMFTHRASNPDTPLPPMSDFLKKILEPPKSVQEKSKAALNKIKKLFPMQLVEKKEDGKKIDEESSNLEETLMGTQNTTASENPTKEEDSGVNSFSTDDEAEEDDLCRITDAASQPMDIDLDELANSM